MNVGGEPLPFDWGVLVPRVIHPVQVAVIEALRWVGVPLSATDLRKLFDDSELALSHISYHVSQLAKTDAIAKVRERPVRGSTEKFYFFPAG